MDSYVQLSGVHGPKGLTEPSYTLPGNVIALTFTGPHTSTGVAWRWAPQADSQAPSACNYT